MKRMIYHDSDPDGWMSAAILLEQFPDAEKTACIRSQLPEFVTGYDEIYIVDYSFDREHMEFLKKNNKQLYWIDHHITRIEEFKNDYEGLQRNDKAGAGLTWEFLHKDKPMPKAVEHVNDYDMWDFKNPKTKPFSLFIQTIPNHKEIETFIKILKTWTNKDYEQSYHIGEKLIVFLEHDLDQQIEVGIEQEFCGYTARFMYGETNRSFLANRALDQYPNIDLTVVTRGEKIENGKKLFKYSLRSRKGSHVDVGKIAKEHGGGGHKHAAAFISEKVY